MAAEDILGGRSDPFSVDYSLSPAQRAANALSVIESYPEKKVTDNLPAIRVLLLQDPVDSNALHACERVAGVAVFIKEHNRRWEDSGNKRESYDLLVNQYRTTHDDETRIAAKEAETVSREAFKRALAYQNNPGWAFTDQTIPLYLDDMVRVSEGKNVDLDATLKTVVRLDDEYREAQRKRKEEMERPSKAVTPTPTTLAENAGWKLHLTTKATAEVAQALDQLGVKYKTGKNSGQTGKDITVYVGSKDEAIRVAKRIENLAGHLLDNPEGDALKDDVSFGGKVMGRFDARGDADFHQYGSNGIPWLNSDMANNSFGDKIDPSEAEARADQILKNRYGAFYQGSQPTLSHDIQSNIPSSDNPGDSPPLPSDEDSQERAARIMDYINERMSGARVEDLIANYELTPEEAKEYDRAYKEFQDAQQSGPDNNEEPNNPSAHTSSHGPTYKDLNDPGIPIESDLTLDHVGLVRAGRAQGPEEKEMVLKLSGYMECFHGENFFAQALQAHTKGQASFKRYITDPSEIDSEKVAKALTNRRDKLMALSHPLRPDVPPSHYELRPEDVPAWKKELAEKSELRFSTNDSEIREIARLTSYTESLQRGILVDSRGFDPKNAVEISQNISIGGGDGKDTLLTFKSIRDLMRFGKSCEDTIDFADTNRNDALDRHKAMLINSDGTVGTGIQWTYQMFVENCKESPNLKKAFEAEQKAKILFGAGTAKKDGNQLDFNPAGDAMGDLAVKVSKITSDDASWKKLGALADGLSKQKSIFSQYHQNRSLANSLQTEEKQALDMFGEQFKDAYTSMTGDEKRDLWKQISQWVSKDSRCADSALGLFLVLGNANYRELREQAAKAITDDVDQKRQALIKNKEAVMNAIQKGRERQLAKVERHQQQVNTSIHRLDSKVTGALGELTKPFHQPSGSEMMFSI